MLILRYVQNKLCQSKRKLFRQSWNLQTSKSQSWHLLLLKSNFILNDKLSVEKEYFNAAFELVSCATLNSVFFYIYSLVIIFTGKFFPPLLK